MLYAEYCHQDAEIETGVNILFPAFNEDYIEIEAGGEECIPLGFRLKLEEGMKLNFSTERLLAEKRLNIDTRIVVDDEFDGEMFVNVFNHNDKPAVIAKYPKDFDKDNVIVIGYNMALGYIHGLGVKDVEVVDNINNI